MSNLAQAVAESQDQLPSGEATPEPIQIELPPEEAVDPQEPPKVADPGAEPPKPKGRPTNQRIVTLVNEKNNLMAMLDAERSRSSDLASRLAKTEVERDAGQVKQMELHKARLQAETERAKQMFREARQAADVDKEAQANALIARAESGLADVEAWEARNRVVAAQQPPAAQPQQQPQPQPAQQPAQQPQRLDPVTQTWITENPWFNQASTEYDVAMHAAAVAYAIRLETKMQADGQSDQIGKGQYFQKISEYMAKEFPDRFEVEQDPDSQTPPVPAVAPATRSQPPSGGTPKPPPGKVLAQLSGSERQIADSLRNSGALLYPANHPKVVANPQLRGKRMTAEDAYIAYGQQLRKDKAEQANRAKTQ